MFRNTPLQCWSTLQFPLIHEAINFLCPHGPNTNEGSRTEYVHFEASAFYGFIVFHLQTHSANFYYVAIADTKTGYADFNYKTIKLQNTEFLGCLIRPLMLCFYGVRFYYYSTQYRKILQWLFTTFPTQIQMHAFQQRKQRKILY